MLQKNLDAKQIKDHFADDYAEYFENRLGMILSTPDDNGQVENVLCPFHPDRNTPSLSINVNEGVWRCYGMCEEDERGKTSGNIFHFEKRYLELQDDTKLDMKKDFPKILQSIDDDFEIGNGDKRKLPDKENRVVADETPSGTGIEEDYIEDYPETFKDGNGNWWLKEEEYEYTDEKGKTQYYVGRYTNEKKDQKTFRPYLQLESGVNNFGLKCGMVEIERVPYHLHELIKSDTVLFVEGEKDVHTAEKLGYVATTTGSKNSWKPKMAKWFKNKNVILIPDNDKAGREHMEKVGATIYSVVNSLKWLDLPHDRQKGFDLTDWYKRISKIDHSHIKWWGQRSARKLFGAQLSIGIRKMAYSYFPEGAPRTAAQLVSAYLPKPKWAVPGIIPEGLTIFAGRPKFGKSMLAMNIALAVTSGSKVMDHTEPAEPGSVLYLAFQDPDKRLQLRLIRMLDGKPAPNNLIFYGRWPQRGEGCLKKLRKEIEANKNIRLVIIDTLADAKPTGESKDGDRYKIDYEGVKPFKELADECQISVLIIHHTRKTKADDIFDTISGTLGLTGAADGMLIGVGVPECRYDGELHCRGRDMADISFSLKFDKDTYWWCIIGLLHETMPSEQRQRLYDAIPFDSVISPKRLKDKTGLTDKYIENTLPKMLDRGQIKRVGHGKYKKVGIDK